MSYALSPIDLYLAATDRLVSGDEKLGSDKFRKFSTELPFIRRGQNELNAIPRLSAFDNNNFGIAELW